MSASEVRVRIAPSPSGYVHVGTARTAIFNYLFARHYGGKFLFRIENTDKERSKPELIEAIISAMKWVGLDWDEDIVYQSERTEMHSDFARRILDTGYGYRCFCTREQLDEDRARAREAKGPLRYNRRCLGLSRDEIDEKLAADVPYAIRLKIPEGETSFHDIVSGDLTRSNEELEDFIIARSDGTATYNLAVVVDDHDMGITHVIRGNDHITNTFKQILLYRALDFKIPEFAHVPLILRPDKRKVSKSRGDKDVLMYREDGILPEAMFNYLCLLGWSPKTDREIYSREELTEIFKEANFNAANTIFDEEKLVAFNHDYIAAASDHDLAAMVAPLLVEAGYTTKYWLETRWEYLRSVIGLLKPRVKRIPEFVPQAEYFFTGDFDYDPEAVAKQFTPEAAGLLSELADRFEALADFDHDTLQDTLNALAEEKDLKRAKLIHPARLAVSGVSKGPSLYEMLVVLSKETVVKRMRRAVEYIGKM